MVRNAVVLYLLLPNGSVYEKHLFSAKEIGRWEHACFFAGVQILDHKRVIVVEEV